MCEETNNVKIGDQIIRRYWVEATFTYYPGGGFDDIKGQYETMEEAKARAEELKAEGYDDVRIRDVLYMLVDLTQESDGIF